MIAGAAKATAARDADSPIEQVRDRWPLTLADQYRMNAKLADAIVGLGAQIEEVDRHRAFQLAAGSILSAAYHLVTIARVLAEAPAHAASVGASTAAYLGGGRPGKEPPIDYARPSLEPPSFAPLRRLARVAAWCPFHRLPRALIAPEAMAISHNGLLCAEATRHAIGFRHAAVVLDAAPPSAFRIDDAIESLAGRSADALVGTVALPSGIAQRLREAISALARQKIGEAVLDLDRLRGVDDLPMNVWSGSAGYWPARVIGLEVLRRGGKVTRFDHGGGLGLRREQTAPALTEFVGTSDFVLPTGEIARRFGSGGRSGAVSLIARPRAHGGHGDPTYRAALRPRDGARRRRVLYGTPPHVGARGMFPPIFPDGVGLELQKRLVRILKSLPIELILRPHPEGLRGGRLNPLAELHPCAQESYEDLLPRADILLFDHIATTTFTIALCTDRPIVMLDYGIRFFQDDIEDMLDRRCTRITVAYDERNLPLVDRETLGAAIRDLPESVDPEPFRSMLLGEYAK